MRKVLAALAVSALAAATSTACATKKFVKGEVGQVEAKVGELSRAVDETTQEGQRTAAHLREVDRTATAAGRAAQAAAEAAAAADASATNAGATADAAHVRVDELDRASKRIIYEVVLSERHGQFRFGGAELPDAARAEIDRLVDRLTADPQGAYIEIEGHTDTVGPKAYNQRLGLERAEAVRQYLYEHHHIPLHRMNVISYGEDRPVAPNTTREGRAQNRRVVIKVLV